jgi:hypothetical protein
VGVAGGSPADLGLEDAIALRDELNTIIDSHQAGR